MFRTPMQPCKLEDQDWIAEYRLGKTPDNLDFYKPDRDTLHDTINDTAMLELAQRAIASQRLEAVGVGSNHVVLALQFRAGERSCNRFVDSTCVDSVLASSLEAYQFLDALRGIWSSGKCRVEAALSGPLLGLHRLGGEVEAVAKSGDTDGSIVRVGPASTDALGLITNYQSHTHPLTISIEHLALSSCQDAKAALETIGNWFLLQLDDICGVLPRLEPRRRGSHRAYETRPKHPRELTYPTVATSSEPMELYIWARNIGGDFAAQRYLAFYHVLEFYFTRGSKERDELEKLLRLWIDPADLHAFFSLECRPDIELLDYVAKTVLLKQGSS
jgi:hypothetical protein